MAPFSFHEMVAFRLVYEIVIYYGKHVSDTNIESNGTNNSNNAPLINSEKKIIVQYRKPSIILTTMKL